MRNQVNQKSHGHYRHWLHQFPGRLITATDCQTYDWPAVSNDEWPPGHRPVTARCTQPTQSCVARPADPGRPQRTRQTATRQQGNRTSVRLPDRKATRNIINIRSYLAPFLRYGNLLAENCVIFLPLFYSTPPLPIFPFEFHGEVKHQETRVMGLFCGEGFVILTSTVFDWSTRVTDGRTDRWTIAYSAL